MVSALKVAERRGEATNSARKGRSSREAAQVMPELGSEEGAGVSQMMKAEEFQLIRQHWEGMCTAQGLLSGLVRWEYRAGGGQEVQEEVV